MSSLAAASSSVLIEGTFPWAGQALTRFYNTRSARVRLSLFVPLFAHFVSFGGCVWAENAPLDWEKKRLARRYGPTESDNGRGKNGARGAVAGPQQSLV